MDDDPPLTMGGALAWLVERRYFSFVHLDLR